MRRLIAFITLIISIISYISCKTDIDTVEPGPSIPIVYSILDNRDSVHYVRVNKSFNGNISSYDMAKYPDSILYSDNLEVTVDIKRAGNLIKTLVFTKTEMQKDSVNHSGEVIFAVDKHYVYAAAGKLHEDDNNDYTYELKVAKGGILIAYSTTTALTRLQSDVRTASFTDRENLAIGFFKPKQAGGVIVDIVISYYEQNRNGKYTIKTIETSSGLKKYDIGSGRFAATFITRNIIELMTAQIGSDSPDVVRRFIGRVQADFYAANVDFVEQLSSRVAGVNAEISPISNIIGGYGLFGSRSYLKDSERPLSSSTYSFFADKHRTLKFAPANAYLQLPDSLKNL